MLNTMLLYVMILLIYHLEWFESHLVHTGGDVLKTLEVLDKTACIFENPVKIMVEKKKHSTKITTFGGLSSEAVNVSTVDRKTNGTSSYPSRWERWESRPMFERWSLQCRHASNCKQVRFQVEYIRSHRHDSIEKNMIGWEYHGNLNKISSMRIFLKNTLKTRSQGPRWFFLIFFPVLPKSSRFFYPQSIQLWPFSIHCILSRA